MWPYDKAVEIEERPILCPNQNCYNSSTGYYEDGEIALAEFCKACKVQTRIHELMKILRTY